MEREVLNAALGAILAPRTFVLTQLQPENTAPLLGGGWGGVLKWCAATARRHTGPLAADPTLGGFDAIVLHLDADVASFAYPQLRPPVETAVAAANGWGALPCASPCPPDPPSASALHAVLLSWLQPATLGPTAVVWLPAMNTGAWLAAAILPNDHSLLPGLECNLNIEVSLAQQPLSYRIRKGRRQDVQAAAPQVTRNWQQVKQRCTRAAAFEIEIRGAVA